jgi:hypothetical protein
MTIVLAGNSLIAGGTVIGEIGAPWWFNSPVDVRMCAIIAANADFGRVGGTGIRRNLPRSWPGSIEPMGLK